MFKPFLVVMFSNEPEIDLLLRFHTEKEAADYGVRFFNECIVHRPDRDRYNIVVKHIA